MADREENPETQSSDDPQLEKRHRIGDQHVLQFLDSMDDYLCHMDSLSLILRQGWFELASARHSMGVSRVNGALLDLNPRPASTSLLVTQDDSETGSECFSLRKWGSGENGLGEEKYGEENLSDGSQLRQRNSSQLSDKTARQNGDPLVADDRVRKERLKSLSVFGTLVSPKLRTAQFSFESALEKLVEIANARSTMLSTFNQLKDELEGTNCLTQK